MDRALRNIVIWAAAMTFVFFTMIYPAFAHAHGSSHPKDDGNKSLVAPCLIKVTSTGTVINANSIDFIMAGEKTVTYYFGRNHEVNVTTNDPQGVISRFVVEVEQKCK